MATKATVTTADGTTSTLDLDRLTFAEADAIETVTGMSLKDAITSGRAIFVRAVVWVALKRVKPELKFSDLADWSMTDVNVTLDEQPDAVEANPTEAGVPA